MSKPTLKNPSIKYIKKSRKGLPIYSWCKTYFEENPQAKTLKQIQVWSMEKPSE